MSEQESKRLASKREAEADALFFSIGDGAIATDEFGRITRVNPVALKLLGYTEAELLGKWFPKVVVATTLDGKVYNLIDRPITKAFLTGQPVASKLYYRARDGQLVPVHVNVSPILLEGKPLGAIEVFRDIAFEEEIDRMKSEFISLASHQLRTPLSAVKTYSHMLADGYMGKVTPTQKKSLHTIIAATNRMNELISTLLNISRIESGTIAVRPKSLKVEAVVEEVLRELTLMAADKSIAMTLKITGSASTTITTDSLILKEILTNLVSNGIKYTPDGGKITIAIRPRLSDVTISVTDTGWGIPKDVQDQIFSKFFRAPNIVRRETTGTGLGLYLVKGLVELLGGRIWFKSEEQNGTTFSLALPRRKPTRKAAPQNLLIGQN